MVSSVRPNPQSKISIRVDNATGFLPLENDQVLISYNIYLDFGRVHNKELG